MAPIRKQGEARAASPHGRAPEWADGLKQLYDSVVEEDLPDSFRHLLDQLDAKSPAHGDHGGDAEIGGDHGGGDHVAPSAGGQGKPR